MISLQDFFYYRMFSTGILSLICLFDATGSKDRCPFLMKHENVTESWILGFMVDNVCVNHNIQVPLRGVSNTILSFEFHSETGFRRSCYRV